MKHPYAHLIGNEITIEKGDRELRINEETDVDIARIEKWIAANIGMAIEKQYSKRRWGVYVDCHGKIVAISCPSISMEKAYHFPMDNMNIHELTKKGVRAAGHILDRHNLSLHRLATEEDAFLIPRLAHKPDEPAMADSYSDPSLKSQKAVV